MMGRVFGNYCVPNRITSDGRRTLFYRIIIIRTGDRFDRNRLRNILAICRPHKITRQTYLLIALKRTHVV